MGGGGRNKKSREFSHKTLERTFLRNNIMTVTPNNNGSGQRPPTSSRNALDEAQALAAAVLPTDMKGKLIASVLIDLVGSSSYLIPLLGEGFDVAWAPLSMILVGAMYDGVMPNLKYVALVEELLPFTDVIPTATLGWLREYGPDIIERRMGERRSKRSKRD